MLIVDPSGIVVTNHHVIEGADQIRVALSDKREFDAEVLLRDQRSDLALGLACIRRITHCGLDSLAQRTAWA